VARQAGDTLWVGAASTVIAGIIDGMWNRIASGYVPQIATSLIFGTLVVLNLFTHNKADHATMILACIAVFPWLLPLLAKYIKEIKIGPVSWQIQETTASRDELERNDLVGRATPVTLYSHVRKNVRHVPGSGGLGINLDRYVAFEAGGESTPAWAGLPDFKEWPQQARKIFRTLWKHQQELFANRDDQRFGFRVEQTSPEFGAFLTGLFWLRDNYLVVVDSRGFCFLSDVGLSLCKTHSTAINQENDFYSEFGHCSPR